jgi:dynein heavy chain
MHTYIRTHIHSQCIMQGGSGIHIDSIRRKPYNWIPDSSWLACIQMYMRIPLFKDLPDSIQRNGDNWRAWFESDAPEDVPMPEVTSCGSKPSKLSLMMIVRALRPDRMPIVCEHFVKSIFGDKVDVSASLSLDTCLAESSERTPLLCIVTPGADWADAVHALCKRLKKEVCACMFYIHYSFFFCCVCVYIYIYIYTYMHTYIHTYT